MSTAEANLIATLDQLLAGGDPVLARRNARARAQGWTSYGQRRYWLPRFGVRKDGSIDKDLQAATAQRLADRICHGTHEPSRRGSYFCRRCDLLVNGNGYAYAPDGTRHGDWRARLVRVAMEA